MQCLKPLLGFYNYDKRKLEIIGDYKGSQLLNRIVDKHGKWMQIPCGHCINCRINRANDWKKRILKECEKYENNHFVTLTYDDFHLPQNKSLNKRDVQLFIKKLRRFLDFHGYDKKIKYFCSGEYGDISRRPHYHLILINCDLSFMDYKMEYIKNENNTNYYNSELIKKLWTDSNGESLGNNIVARVVKESVAYTTKYTLKKQYGDNADIYEKFKIIPEFMICSKGIGIDFLNENIDKLAKSGKMMVSDGVNYGTYEPLPKYFKKKIKEYSLVDYVNLNLKNAVISEEMKNNIFDNTDKNFVDYNFVKEDILNSIYKNKGIL